jgi:hypothetical protein
MDSVRVPEIGVELTTRGDILMMLTNGNRWPMSCCARLRMPALPRLMRRPSNEENENESWGL